MGKLRPLSVIAGLALAVTVTVIIAREDRELRQGFRETPDIEVENSRKAPPEEPDPEHPPLTVHVCDEENKPIASADVLATAPAKRESATTDRDGNAQIPGTFSLEYGVTASRNGYANSNTVAVDIRGMKRVVIRLRKIASVRGSVLLPDGRPAADAEVLLADHAETGDVITGGRIYDQAHRSRCDRNGSFSVDGIWPGEKLVVATLDGYAPGVSDPFDVRPGTTKEGVVIRLRRSSRVTVRVTGEGKAIDHPVVQAGYRFHGLLDAHGGRIIVRSKQTGEEHSFATLPPETVIQLRIEAPGWRTHIEAPFRLREGEDRSFSFDLKRGERLTGTVRDLSGTPVADVEILASQGQGDPVQGVTDDKGRFDIEGLSVRPVLLTLKKTGHVTRRYANVPAGTTEAVYSLPRTARISGSISGTEGRTVFIVYRNGPAKYRVQHTGDGPFDLPTVPPGALLLQVETKKGRVVGSMEVTLEEGEHRSDVSLICRGA